MSSSYLISDVQTLPVTLSLTVSAAYMDANRHMNTRWYLHIFTDAVWNFLSLLGVDDNYRIVSNAGTVALRHVLDYLSSVHENDQIEIRSRLVGFSASQRRIHHFHFMVNLTTNSVASILESHSAHYSVLENKITEFPENICTTIRSTLSDHNKLSWTVFFSGAVNL